jgi:hypothetical protein
MLLGYCRSWGVLFFISNRIYFKIVGDIFLVVITNFAQVVTNIVIINSD